MAIKITDNLELHIVRAFPTSEEVQEKYAIFANFSCQLVAKVGKQTIPVLAINALTIRQDRERTYYFIGSMGQEQPNNRGMIWSNQFFPGAGKEGNEDLEDRQIKFTDEVIEEVTKFIESKQQEFKEKEQKRKSAPVPTNLSRLAGIKPLTKRGGKSAERDTEDVPF